MQNITRGAILLSCVIAACGGEKLEPERTPNPSTTGEQGTTSGETTETPEVRPPLELVIGTGDDGFEPLMDEQIVPVVDGPQGGSHIWGAFRVNGLSEQRARVSFRLSLMEDGSEQAKAGPLLVRPERASPEGWFELSGLTIVLDDPRRVRGSRCRLDVEIADRDGRTASGSRIVEAR